jgi:3-isopropylmalate/(R)-2-methylmalate dehydratase small subunit
MNTQQRFIKQVKGTLIPIPGDNIDTDRIIPARFMKGITFDGLGEFAFYDERFDEQGNTKPHPFNNKIYEKGSILLVESNFGCGSSREHAPQSLARWGIKAIIGVSFADIFAGNCVQIGIPAVRVCREHHQTLLAIAKKNPEIEFTIDLEKKKVICAQAEISVSIDDAACKALVSGLWDTTSMLLENRELILNKGVELPYGNA